MPYDDAPTLPLDIVAATTTTRNAVVVELGGRRRRRRQFYSARIGAGRHVGRPQDNAATGGRAAVDLAAAASAGRTEGGREARRSDRRRVPPLPARSPSLSVMSACAVGAAAAAGRAAALADGTVNQTSAVAAAAAAAPSRSLRRWIPAHKLISRLSLSLSVPHNRHRYLSARKQ